VAHGNRTASNYHNAPSLFQLVIGNAGQPEGPTTFDNGPFPDWSAVRYGSYGFSTVTVSPTKMKFVHHQANVDGTLGKVIDRFELTKDKAHSKRNCIA
jgi:hypothetical protein